MKKKIFLFILLVVLSIVQAMIFLLAYSRLFVPCGISDCFLALVHSVPQSAMVSAWLMLPAFLVGVGYAFFPGNWHRRFMIGYVTLALMILLFLTCIDWILYGFWGFRIDTTPFIYIFDNPEKAIGRTPWWGFLITFGTVFLIGWFICRLMSWLYPKHHHRALCSRQKLSILQKAGGNLALAVLMLVIGNGCFGLMGIGSAYFSDYQPLNHAATHPIYNLCHSIRQHFVPLDSQYRFMSESERSAVMSQLFQLPAPEDSHPERLLLSDTVASLSASSVPLLKPDTRPNVLLIAFESFSGAASHYLYPEADPSVMPNYDRAMSEGVAFTNFYANSFRTERAFVSLLSGYPGQPTFSLMTDDARTRHLHYLTRPLIDAGYSTEFLYGGDGKFCHLDTYLDFAGFERQIEKDSFSKESYDADFGMHDGFMFNYLFDLLKKEALTAADMLAENPARPYFKFFATLSSHEPFDVPMHRLPDPYLNSVAYTDSCLGAFLDKVRADHSVWDNLLIICLPDHCYSNYPEGIQQNDPLRYHIPMFWTGGAVAGHVDVEVLSQQTDLAVSLLHLLGFSTEPGDFPFSHDIFDPLAPHFAFYTWPDGFGFLTDSCSYVQDNHYDGHPLKGSNDPAGRAQMLGKAYLQTLFDHISSLR